MIVTVLLSDRPGPRFADSHPNAQSFCRQSQIMYSTITQDIQITVEPEFVPEKSDADQATFFWAYTVEIANQGGQTVQLTERHWKITDANGRLEEVKGPGVVGEQPVLKPGETFRYTSGCPLTTPSGIMTGSYRWWRRTARFSRRRSRSSRLTRLTRRAFFIKRWRAWRTIP